MLESFMEDRPNIQPVWLPQLPSLSFPLPPQALQLMQQPSLTRAFKSLGGEFTVRVLYLGEGGGDVWLPHPESAACFIRDVLLAYNGTPVVWARSLCLSEATQWRSILDCGSRPLGEQLFDGSLDVQRTPVEYAAVEGCVLPDINEEPLAARRSVFSLHGHALGLIECFLAGIAQV